MFVLLLLSFAAVGLIIGKYRQLLHIAKLNRAVVDKLSSLTDSAEQVGILQSAIPDSPLAVVLLKTWQMKDEDYIITKDNIESTANLLIHKLEKGLGWLSTIAAIAPLIGFLGTVTGMVRVFINIQARSQNGIDISFLAGGIWEALLTTVGGLIVGIFAIICYNDLVQHAENIAKHMQEQIDEFLIQIKFTAGKSVKR